MVRMVRKHEISGDVSYGDGLTKKKAVQLCLENTKIDAYAEVMQHPI